MANLEIKYCTYDKALPPQPIRMKVPGWSGSVQKMVDGSEPEPWHCLPFTEGATYGLELIYQYETECHVVNDNGSIRFEWDFASEPDSSVTGGEFVTFYPKPYSKFYLFNTSLDIAAPPGHVIATHPHPRFFTDDTGSVPISLTGHVQTEWWPKKFFVVFKAPMPGQRHIFRKGEPYVELRVIPQRAKYDLLKMDGAVESRRRALERDILLSASEIASNTWRNPSDYAFNNHYKILASAFARQGLKGVEQAVALAGNEQRLLLSDDAPIADYLALGQKRFEERKFNEAKHIYVKVLRREPINAAAVNRLGVIAAVQGMPLLALKLMRQAAALAPQSTDYLDDLGELYRRLGRYDEAEASFRASVQLNPHNAQALSNLGVTLSQQGRLSEGMAACKEAIVVGESLPGPYYRMGVVLAQQNQMDAARVHFDAALARDPNYEEAKKALDALPAASALSERASG